MTDTLIHRWSKRKSENTKETADARQPVADSESCDLPTAERDESINALQDENEAATEQTETPSLNSLTADSDYSAFLSPEVDAGLRKLALRKLFKAPFYNIRDGLNEYDDDFTTFQELGDIITSDMKFHAERKEQEARDAELERMRNQETEDAERQAETATSEELDEGDLAEVDPENPEKAAAEGSEDEFDQDDQEGPSSTAPTTSP